MGFLSAILTLVLVGLVVLVVSEPLRRARRVQASGAASSLASRMEYGGAESPPFDRQEELEAAREAKYREIRDAELDYRTGKLSRDDYEAIDADLRSEAIEILNRLEPSGPVEPSGPGSLEQQEGVQEEQHGEEDRPAI